MSAALEVARRAAGIGGASVDISDCRPQAGVCTGPIVHDT